MKSDFENIDTRDVGADTENRAAASRETYRTINFQRFLHSSRIIVAFEYSIRFLSQYRRKTRFSGTENFFFFFFIFSM